MEGGAFHVVTGMPNKSCFGNVSSATSGAQSRSVSNGATGVPIVRGRGSQILTLSMSLPDLGEWSVFQVPIETVNPSYDGNVVSDMSGGPLGRAFGQVIGAQIVRRGFQNVFVEPISSI